MIYALIALTIAFLINTYTLIEYAEAYRLKVWKAGNIAMYLSLCGLAYFWVQYLN